MVKFAIQFHTPADLPTFETAYNDFLALVERMPNITRRQVNSVLGSPTGDTPLYRILEVYFSDYPQLDAALKSTAGQEAGAELRRFAPGSFTMFFAEVYEESGGRTPGTP